MVSVCIIGICGEILDSQAASKCCDGTKASLRLHKLAANQGSVESRVRIGDYYYYGFISGKQDASKAAKHYRKAAQLKDPQAMFSLATMYENGEGLAQDLHLAHRYYDMAMATDSEATVPVYIALASLWCKEVYGALFQDMSTDGMSSSAKSFIAFFKDDSGTFSLWSGLHRTVSGQKEDVAAEDDDESDDLAGDEYKDETSDWVVDTNMLETSIIFLSVIGMISVFVLRWPIVRFFEVLFHGRDPEIE